MQEIQEVSRECKQNFLMQVLDMLTRVDALLDLLTKQGRELLDDAALGTVTVRKCGVQGLERNEQDKQWKYNCGLQQKTILASSWTYSAGSDEKMPLGGAKGPRRAG